MEISEDSSTARPAECIIHHASSKLNIYEQLTTPTSYESWLVLLDAAKVRDHVGIIQLANKLPDDQSIPKLPYHRQCRSIFTMKRDLDSLKRKADDSEPPTPGGSHGIKRHNRSPSESRIYDKQCIFCKKVQYIKGLHTKESLVKSVDLRADITLRRIATARQDTNILTATSRDIVAAEAHYHRSCYKEYSRIPGRPHHGGGETCSIQGEREHSDDHQYSILENESYLDLFDYMRNDFISSHEVATLHSVTTKLIQIMVDKGVKVIKDSTKKHIRRKFENEFGNSLHIFPDEQGKLLVIPDGMSVFDLAKKYQALQRELDVWKAKASIYNTIDKASSLIRSGIKHMDVSSKWPYHPSNTTKELVVLPTELKRFFVGLLTGKPEEDVCSPKVEMLVDSFSQDMVYAVTGGLQKTQKHILLSYGVKTLTGNVELIKILNRLGHGISYSQLEENDTALCLQKLSASSTQVIIPENIQPYVFTNLAFDNIDRLEETLTGAGTTHRVNGIAVQPRVYGPHPIKQPLPVIEKTKQRTVVFEDKQLSSYFSGERVGPHPLITPHDGEDDKAHEIAQTKDLIWMLTREIDPSSQTIPSWAGFNINTRKSTEVLRDVIEYLPTINAPATEMSTVLEIIYQSELMRKELKIEKIVVVMDQALYAKATEILWKHKDKYANIVIRMGTFHTIMNILAILGKRFQDAGLRDICIESGLIAQGSVSAVLDGKMYNRAVRVHKSVYEALQRIARKGFMTWLEVNHQDKMQKITAFLNQIHTFHDEFSQENFDTLVQHTDATQSLVIWNKYLEYLRNNNGDMSAFWMSYIDIVGDILLGLIRASREGNWKLHLSAIRKMIPWCFAYDRLNYARYLPAYFAQMMNLPTDHPQVYQHFCSGGFSVQLTDDNPFGRIPVDQTTEVTVNKDTKTAGGTTKFSQNSRAVCRFYLTAEHRSGFLGNLRDMIRVNRNTLHHSELQQPRIKRDEKFVSTVSELVEDWINPFGVSQELACISTASMAPSDVRNDLLKANATGEKAYQNFKAERLESDSPRIKFHDPMKKINLKTFSSLSKKRLTQTRGKSIMMKTDRTLFGRMIIIAQSRSLELKDVFTHPLGPLPWSLANPEGFPRKTVKATIASHLQKLAAPAYAIPHHSATVIDGMSLVQKVRHDLTTFGEVADALHGMILKEGQASQRIDVVFDTYKEISSKNVERSEIGEEQGHRLQNITATQLVRQWGAFLKQMNNKSSLIEFLFNEWQKAKYVKKLRDKTLFVTCLEKCCKITETQCEDVPSLSSNHEEADGRLLHHAAHAADAGYAAAIICSEDTDVFILCLAFSELIGVPLFQRCGTKTRYRLVDIGKIATAIGSEVCKALIGMHAFTGCDTVSAFAGKGKIRALEIIKSNQNARNTFIQLGEQWTVSEDLHKKLETFTCLLYATMPGTCSVNELRYNLFCSKKGESESHQLPPCLDCLKKHSLRANHQSAIWKRSIQGDAQIPGPHGNGWKLETVKDHQYLTIDWMDGSPAPDAVLELLSCKCSRTCKLPSCICLVNGLRCTDMCRLRDCNNQPSEESETYIDDTGDIEDEEDD